MVEIIFGVPTIAYQNCVNSTELVFFLLLLFLVVFVASKVVENIREKENLVQCSSSNNAAP